MYVHSNTKGHGNGLVGPRNTKYVKCILFSTFVLYPLPCPPFDEYTMPLTNLHSVLYANSI